MFQTIETETNRGRFEEFETFLSGDATAVNESTAAAAVASKRAGKDSGESDWSEKGKLLPGGTHRGPKGWHGGMRESLLRF